MSLDLSKMELLEVLEDKERKMKIVRVPGGWIFAFYDNSVNQTITNSQFVPEPEYEEEVATKPKEKPGWNDYPGGI